MDSRIRLDRRAFVVGSVAAGLSIGFHLPGAGAAAAAGTAEINAWVVVKPDDSVVIRIARSEMGQGTLTGLAQLVAEELECDWSRVTTEFPGAGQNLARGRPWGSMATGGSRGIRDSHEAVRKGGAAARRMLLEAAARQWDVPVGECAVTTGVVTHKASGRQAGYGSLAAAAAQLPAPAADRITLKDPKDWTIAGKPLKRLDTRPKLDGSLVYGIDIRLPGMVCAAIRQCPVFGGTLRSFDAATVDGLAGVRKIVRVGDNAVAVVATTWAQAKQALDRLAIVWEEGANAAVQQKTIDDMLAAGLGDEVSEQIFVGNSVGDARAALAKAARKVEAVYAYPYQSHANMEPMNATALYTADRCEVWCPTQNAESALTAASEASGLPPGQCEIHKTFLGTGFGRRGISDYVTQAVRIARELPGTPVKLIWSREEDMSRGWYHPITQCRLVAGLDSSGKVDALHIRISGQSILAGLLPHALRDGKDPVVFQGLVGEGESMIGYTIPNLRVDHAMRNPHVPPAFWRIAWSTRRLGMV